MCALLPIYKTETFSFGICYFKSFTLIIKKPQKLCNFNITFTVLWIPQKNLKKKSYILLFQYCFRSKDCNFDIVSGLTDPSKFKETKKKQKLNHFHIILDCADSRNFAILVLFRDLYLELYYFHLSIMQN